MRLVDSLFFALAFLVHSIVCQRNRNPDPPYKVVKMTPAQVPGVMIECETHLLDSNLKYLRTELNVYPVEENIYAVIQGDTIIGHTTYVIPGKPQILHGIYGNLHGWHEEIYYELEIPGDPHQRMVHMYNSEAYSLGVNRRLPDNTIFHDVPEQQIRRVYSKREDNRQIVTRYRAITPFRRL